MSAAVRPLRADEFAAWRKRSQAAYSDDMIRHAGIDDAAAAAKAQTDYDNLLPNGVDSDGHSLFAIEEDGVAAGSLWLGERDGESGPTLFVYEVYVDESARGRGLGRAAMLFAEEETRRRGIAALALNVMGGNDAARGLYRSLGYDEVAVFMRKAV